MVKISPASTRRRRVLVSVLVAVVFLAVAVGNVAAHPLGNFSINRFARIEPGAGRIGVRYVIDMAEIPTFQESQTIDADGDGSLASAELNAYLRRVAAEYADSILLTIDGVPVPLQSVAQTITTPAGAGGLPTLRIVCDFAGELPVGAGATRRLLFADNNYGDRLGWREIVVAPAPGVAVFDSTAFGNGVTDELKAYPDDMLAAPLDERTAELSFTEGDVPAGAGALLTRDGRPAAPSRDRLAELIAVPELTTPVALLALLVALGLGAVHALSPGHGKAVVGAYLVGSRGTIRHAAFLGLTVTVTHTLGVFALGVVTLFASQYIVPERIFPVLSLISGGIVLTIGLSLFVRRLRVALGHATSDHTHHSHTRDHTHHHHHAHPHDHLEHSHSHHYHQHHDHQADHHDDHHHGDDHAHHDHAHGDAHHSHAHHDHGADGSVMHSHGGKMHSHLPPGADGSRITWRSLLALGISGGLLPCPSALVVMLSAISLGRVGFGLLLVVAFSVGLAVTLTGIGLMFIYAGHLLNSSAVSNNRLVRVLPAVSAFVIACVGAAMCYEALGQTGLSSMLSFGFILPASLTVPPGSLSTSSVLAFGFVIGLKHAVEADHMAAVSTIVSERKSLLSSSLVGGLWGVGHTITLFVVGLAVILLQVRIGDRLALALEFGVAVMLITLGANALRKLVRGGRVHFHPHPHGSHTHAHPHIHDGSPDTDPHTHHGFRFGARPVVIGMVHGLAGSAALMLLVLSTITSSLVGLLYIVIFGIGSIGGMMIMSALIGLPVHLTANRFTRVNQAIRGLAGLFSLGFGLFMVYEIGFVEGLFR